MPYSPGKEAACVHNAAADAMRSILASHFTFERRIA